MSTDGFAGFYIETRNYCATAAFWRSMGFELVFETITGRANWSTRTADRTCSSPNRATVRVRSRRIRSSVSPILSPSRLTAPPSTPADSHPDTGALSRRPVAIRTVETSACRRPSPLAWSAWKARSSSLAWSTLTSTTGRRTAPDRKEARRRKTPLLNGEPWVTPA